MCEFLCWVGVWYLDFSEVRDCVAVKKSPIEYVLALQLYEGWNFNSGNYLFTTDTK